MADRYWRRAVEVDLGDFDYARQRAGRAQGMFQFNADLDIEIENRTCLAPPICSLDAGFFDEGMTINKFPKYEINIYCRCCPY